MPAPLARIVSALLVLAGLVGTAHADDLPACEYLDGVVVPDPLGGQGCAVELFAAPGPHDRTWFDLTHLPIAGENAEYAFEVVLDRRELKLSNGTDWFRVLLVRTLSESGAARQWAIDVKSGPAFDSQMRMVESVRESTRAEWTIVSSIGLAAPSACTRVEVAWSRMRPDAQDPGTSLAWHVSTPRECDSWGDYSGPVQTILRTDVGELRVAGVGSIGLIGTGRADGEVVANLLAF